MKHSKTKFTYTSFPSILVLGLLKIDRFFPLLCFDLDETLIAHGKALSKDSLRKFSRFIEAQRFRGTKVVYASARDKKSTLDAVNQYDLPSPDFIITDLGQYIFSRDNDMEESLFSFAVDKDWNSRILDNIHLKLDYLIQRKPSRSNSFKKTYYFLGDGKHALEGVRSFLREERQYVDVYESGHNSLYIVPKGCSKGNALAVLKKRLGVTSEEVFVAGDSEADGSLFMESENAVLVGNASVNTKARILGKHRHVFISNKRHVRGVLDGFRYFNRVYQDSNSKALTHVRDLLIKGEFEYLSSPTAAIPYWSWSHASRVFIRGTAYERQGLFLEARSEYKRYLSSKDVTKDKYMKSLFLVAEARARISLGELTEGINILEDIRFLNTSPFRELNTYRLNSLAYGYRLAGKLNEAGQILNKIRRGKGSIFYLTILHNSAGLYRDFARYKRALSLYKTLGGLVDPRDLFFTARICNNAGFIHRKLKEYKKAEELYVRSLKIEEKIGSKQLQGRTLNNLGGINRLQKKYQVALDFFSRSISLRKEAGDRLGLSSSLLNKGVVLSEMGSSREAKRALEESLKIRQKAGSPAMIEEVKNALEKL